MREKTVFDDDPYDRQAQKQTFYELIDVECIKFLLRLDISLN